VQQAAEQCRARQAGITALSLLAGTAAAALVLAGGYYLGVAATLVAFLGGIPGLYLMWAAYRDDRAEADARFEKLDLGEVADELAVADSRGPVRLRLSKSVAPRRVHLDETGFRLRRQSGH
jgi:hypothetical protein